MLINKLHVKNLLSFGDQEIELKNLNLLIGHNGSGKSNLLEAIALLQATPSEVAMSVRESGGGVQDWIWKGVEPTASAHIEATINRKDTTWKKADKTPLKYTLDFAVVNRSLELTNERVENEKPLSGKTVPRYYFFYQNGFPIINAGNPDTPSSQRKLKREDINPEKSILAQRKDPDLYPEITWLAEQFAKIKIYREWSFGRTSKLRRPTPTDLETTFLREDFSNLALVLNNLGNKPEVRERMLKAMRCLYPSINNFGIEIQGNTAQIFLHEGSFSIPATRLSDGTLRYLCLLAILCHPTPPPLVCIEEPELGLHPDAIIGLADLIKDAAQRTQLIVTTHSDLLIDQFTDQPETVVTFTKYDNATQMQRLDAKELSEWLQRYSLAEMRQSGHIEGNRW